MDKMGRSTMKQLLLIDAKNFCYRAHWTRAFLSSEGRPTSVLHGALSMLITMQRKIKAPVIFCWDGEGETWRHKLVKHRAKQYKGNRSKAMTEARSAIYKQIPLLKDFLNIMGIWNIEIDNLEADDLIGILATSLKNEYDKIIIVSGDRDFYQLASDKIAIWSTQGKNKGDFLLTPKLIEREWGVKPKDYMKLRALSGDSGDNISNVLKGIGPKTASKMVQEGIRPDFISFADHNQFVINKYKNKLQPVWEAAHQNYQLCKILTSVKDSYLTVRQSKWIEEYLKNIKTESANRSKTSLRSYREAIDFLVDFDLESILENMQKLWAIP